VKFFSIRIKGFFCLMASFDSVYLVVITSSNTKQSIIAKYLNHLQEILILAKVAL